MEYKSTVALRRLNPPLHLLRAFIEVGRFGNVSRAAQALHLTQSAVSKQLQELERWIGVDLFERSHKRLVMTPAGQSYEKAVRAILGQLEAATLEAIASKTEGGTLHISVFPTFGAKWLIPRLPDFQRRHPEVTLRFVPHVYAYDFHRSDLDCSIAFSNGSQPDAQCHYVDGREVVLIAPGTHGTEARIRSVKDIARHTLLHHIAVPDAWLRWQETHAVKGFDALVGPQFDQFETMIRAVAAGLGIALVPRCLVNDEIEAGLVTAPLAGTPYSSYDSEWGYWFCHPESRSRVKPLVTFRSWLLGQAAKVPRRPAD